MGSALPETPSAPPEVAQLLAAEARGAARRRIWRWAAGAGAIIAFMVAGREQQLRYVTAKAERGELPVVVTATGTLQPTNQVDVGSELSGIVKSVEVDFNDRVKVGQPLARLDPARLEAQVVQSEAALSAARARLREAETNEDELRRKLARAQELFGRTFVSEESLVTAQAAHQRAVAARQSARSQVEQAQAALAVDRTK